MTKRESNKTPRAPTTYHSLASAGLELESSGRFAVDAAVVGSTPDAGSAYPAASAAQSDLVGIEAPTGIAIDAQEAVGEVFEIEASLARLERERSGDA
jgi:hypothetical protein